jgi:hypothetical protein
MHFNPNQTLTLGVLISFSGIHAGQESPTYSKPNRFAERCTADVQSNISSICNPDFGMPSGIESGSIGTDQCVRWHDSG